MTPRQPFDLHTRRLTLCWQTAGVLTRYGIPCRVDVHDRCVITRRARVWPLLREPGRFMLDGPRRVVGAAQMLREAR